MNVAQRVQAFYLNQKDKLEWHSGKWFQAGEEIKDIKRYLVRIPQLQISNADDLQKFIDYYIIMYGQEDLWPELPIIQEAKDRIKEGKVKQMAFPLDEKQLMIIRVMLEGKEERMFIATGRGGTGKSTYLNIIRQIYDNDFSACPLSEMTGYNLTEALKHRLIASDELSADDLDSRALKTVISRQPVQLNGKYERPVQIIAQSAMFFCCNRPPRVDVDDTGILRRIVYFEMDRVIENPDPEKAKHTFTHDELVDIVAHAYMLDMTNWYDKFKKETRKYICSNNSVWLYRKIKVYGDYREACRDAGLKAYSLPRWEKIREIFAQWIQQEEDEIRTALAPTADEIEWKSVLEGDELPF